MLGVWSCMRISYDDDDVSGGPWIREMWIISSEASIHLARPSHPKVPFSVCFHGASTFAPFSRKVYLAQAHKNISYLWNFFSFSHSNTFRYCRMCLHIHITYSHAFLLDPPKNDDDVNTFIHNIFMFFLVVMFLPSSASSPFELRQHEQLINPRAELVFVWTIIYVDMGHASGCVAHFPIDVCVCVRKGENFLAFFILAF